MGSERCIHVLVTNDLSADRRMHRICDSLAREGYRIHLLGRQLELSPPLNSQKYRQQRLSLFFESGPLLYLEINLRFFLLLLFQKTDAIYSVDADTLVAGVLLATIRRVPLIYDAHEWFAEVPELADKGLKRRIWDHISRRGAKSASLRFTVNPVLAQKLEEAYGQPFISLKNVPQRSQPEALERRRIILYQGALNRDRGLEELLLASAELPSYSIWLAGRGDIEQKLRKMCDTLGINERVRFWGHVDRVALLKLGSQAFLGYNLLSGDSKSYYYSLSNKFFDYMQAGLPSLNPPYPAYKEILDRHPAGLVVLQTGPEQIVEAVHRIERDPALYERMSGAAREAARIYNWEEEEGILLSAISDVMDSPSRGFGERGRGKR